MPTGELQGLYQDMALTNLAARRKKTGLIVPRIFASMTVAKPTGIIYVRDPKNTALKVQDTVRAIGGEAKALYSGEPDTIDFKMRDHALSDLLPDEMRIADSVLQDELNKVEEIMDALDLEREVKTPAAIKSTLVTAGYTDTPSEKFDAASPAVDPIDYLAEQINLTTPQIGVRPNFIAMDYLVAAAITAHPKFVERVKYTLTTNEYNRGIASMETLLASVLAINEVIISEGHVQNTAVKGADTATLTNIWGDEILIGYKEAPNTSYAGLGIQLNFSGFVNVGGSGVMQVINGYAVERARNARRMSDEFFVHSWYDDKIINAVAGRWITDVLT